MSADHAVDQPAPRWPRLVVVRALLPLGILGALALSAAATIDLARRQGVAVEVQPAAVAMLEVVSTAGTLLAIFATTGRLRARALVALSAASGVSLVAGVSAYGWFGTVAPIGLVGLVHLAAEAWQEERADRGAFSTEPAAVDESAVGAPTTPVGVVLTSDGPEPASTESAEDAPVLDEPAVEPVALDDRPVEGPLTLVDELRSRSSLPSERALVLELDPDGRLGTTRHFAKVVLREAKTGLSAVSA